MFQQTSLLVAVNPHRRRRPVPGAARDGGAVYAANAGSSAAVSWERASFHARNERVVQFTFGDGDSPLNGGGGVLLDDRVFGWKHQIQCTGVVMTSGAALETTMLGRGVPRVSHLLLGAADLDAQTPYAFQSCPHAATTPRAART